MRRGLGALPVLLAATLLGAALPAFGKGDAAPGAASAARKPVVVHVGDSFLGSGFAQSLRPRFEALGAKYVTAVQTSAYTTTLPRQVKLDLMLGVHRPALAIVTIGANEMSMPIPEMHAHAVQNLAKMLSVTQCVFALPPRWDDRDAGILAIERRDAGPCRVYDPTPIAASIPRRADKIHPTMKGGALWADGFWAWLNEGHAPGEAPWDPPRAAPASSGAPPAASSP